MFKKSFLKELARRESVSPSLLEAGLKNGSIVIPFNKNHRLKEPVAIGRGLKVKVNTNIGTSTEHMRVHDELQKLSVAIEAGTDAVMDLSTGGNLKNIRRQIVKRSPVCVGTVPLYEIAHAAEKKYGSFEKITRDDILDVLTEQAKEGVDFFTIHSGILKKTVSRLQKNKRTGGIVSRGGAILARWMVANKRENPLYEYFDRILDIARQYNITLSLGDALRPGAIADSTDRAQRSELTVLGKLAARCRQRGVQVMIEGPGHIRLDEIALNMRLQKKLCNNSPFYVLGPLPTDIACGHDHITSAIGGAIAALNGASFLCVVTPAEHLRHPSVEDVRDGVIASKIAAHCVDVLRFKDEWERDRLLSLHRARRRWSHIYRLALDKKKTKEYHKSFKKSSEDICTMCGKFCSLKIIDNCNLLK